jgi:gas vesicle protein
MADDVKDEDRLTEEAKRAIRAYILKLVTPSAIALSIISAVIGYVARGWGETEAMKVMFDKLSGPVIASAENVGRAEEQSKNLSTQIRQSADIVDRLRASIEKSKLEADDLKSLNYEKITEVLIGKPGLADKLSKLTDQQYSALRNQIDQIKSALLRTSSDVQNVDGRIMKCPDGYYVIGWTFQDQAGLGH